MEYYQTSGYGIYVGFVTVNFEKLMDYIKSCPNLSETVMGWMKRDKPYEKDENISLDKIDSICSLIQLASEHGDFSDDGLTVITHMILQENMGIPLITCTDTDGNNFVLMPSYYPWEITDKILQIKNPDDIKTLFAESLKIITDIPIDRLEWGEHIINNFS